MSTATLQSEKKKTLVPKLRFQGFARNGKIYIKHFFKDIFLFSTGKNIKQSEASPEFEIPCVRYGELYHMYNEVIYKIINKTNLHRSELLFSKGDEILLPSAGEDPLDIGSASALTVANVAIGRTINVLRPVNENVYSQVYVSYYINEKLRKKISKLAKGSSISNVYNSDLKTLEITLPTLPEQQKIASFLNAVDEKIQQLSRKKELLEQYKKGVMQQLFSGKLRFKDENGEDYPDWEKVNGNVLFESISNKNHNSDLPILAITQDQGAVPRDLIEYKVSVTDKSIDSYKVVEIGDFVISLRSFQGGIEYSNYKGICSPAYIILRPTSEKVNKSFYKTYFKTSSYIKELQKNLEGIRDGKMISFKYFSEIKLPLPSFEEQQKIANFLSSIDDKIESTNKQITQTQTFKKGLLQQMFV
ncbi:restriction endonuclease subunit S [Flavobacterium piscisymbiosum]|uniref:Restriction endonuclease subunit S n=1 Tax=Flavobacterium piscisymbiosum TaxID=2893753 RepID=A0ABS8MLS7_9FLAO|nr:restriction endonuclease subunit S [Flavobacterium sp. F-30]MCC9066456.1 restriction endonuclease subunit S [Flavobacterium sp. F-30]